MYWLPSRFVLHPIPCLCGVCAPPFWKNKDLQEFAGMRIFRSSAGMLHATEALQCRSFHTPACRHFQSVILLYRILVDTQNSGHDRPSRSQRRMPAMRDWANIAHCDIPLLLRPATEDPTSKCDDTPLLSTFSKPCPKPSQHLHDKEALQVWDRRRGLPAVPWGLFSSTVQHMSLHASLQCWEQGLCWQDMRWHTSSPTSRARG